MRRYHAFLVLLVAMLFACAGVAPNILHVQAGPSGVKSKRIEVNDRFLERNIMFGDVIIRPLDPGGHYETQVTLTNESDRDVAFEYRFVWYDVQGFELPQVTSWIPAVLGAKESRGFRSAVPATEAASFKLMVRRPHPVTPTGS